MLTGGRGAQFALNGKMAPGRFLDVALSHSLPAVELKFGAIALSDDDYRYLHRALPTFMRQHKALLKAHAKVHAKAAAAVREAGGGR